jgi:hypothetical protein
VPCLGDLTAFFEVTMLEAIDFDFSSYPKISGWVSEMRKIGGIR